MQRLLVLALSTLGTFPAYGKVDAKKRDLGAKFADEVCAGTLGGAAKAWTVGVYDAQLEGRRIHPLTGLHLTQEQVDRKARTLARINGSTGYAAGICKDGSGWAAAMPASAPASVDKNHRVKLPLGDLGTTCETYRADFAPDAGGSPKSLPLAAGGIATASLGDGVIGVTCQPKAPRWRGPTLWYLIPTGNGPSPAVPEAEVFAEAPAMAVADVLAAWVNRIRLKEGLRAVEFKADLTDQAGVLAVDGGLAHDRLLLKKTASLLLENAKLRLIGEDRVRGRDAAQMAWLWWNSPRHRSLILNADATAAGLASRQVGDEHLAVLAMAAAAPVVTAKAPTHKGKPAKR